jgi:Ran GTPase-activating protein (RanGAP) involved in mRNA processing and transport
LCWKEEGLKRDVRVLLMTELDFVHRPAAGEMGVAEALRNQTSLERLYIRGAWFRDDEGEELGAALAQNTSLKELYLSEVYIGERGFKNIFEALKINKTLTHLYMHHSFSFSDDLARLADMLVSNSSLELVILGNN